MSPMRPLKTSEARPQGGPRVVILSAFASPLRSGAEACAEEVAARLKDDFDITIVAARMDASLPREGKLESGVPVVRVGFGNAYDKWLFPLLGALEARRLKPDIVHAVLESFAGLALWMTSRLHPPAKRVLTCQSTNTSLLLKPMHRAAHVVTAISTPLVERARTFGRDAVLIPNGIDLAALTAAAARVEPLPGRILFVGRLEPMKGVDTLLQAMTLLQSRDDWTLHVVGDGSQRDALRRLAKSLGIADRARFLGRLTGAVLWNEYAEARIFCGLSRSEALGNVFLEAQAAGCAVVATNIGGIPDVVLADQTGLLVPPDNPQAAADAIAKLLDDATLRDRLAVEAREHAGAYDWNSIAPRYAAIYRPLAAHR
jgi:glycosyltransferase involved in cell wall biosynthesis